MKLEINVADDLYCRAVEIAAEETIPIDEVFTSAFEARHIEFDRLQGRARRGNHEKFLRVMSKVPDVPPLDDDTPLSGSSFSGVEGASRNFTFKPRS